MDAGRADSPPRSIGLGYAYAIDKIRGEAFAKALVFLPTAISFVGAAVIWGLMYQQPSQNAPSGLVNVVLNWVGLGPLNFPTVGGWKLTLMMIVVMIWIQAGFATVVLSAAIKARACRDVRGGEDRRRHERARRSAGSSSRTSGRR